MAKRGHKISHLGKGKSKKHSKKHGGKKKHTMVKA